MHDIFLSYSRTDTEIMQKVKQTLLDADFNVSTVGHIESFTDEWEQTAKWRIQKSDVVLCILSPEAKLSQEIKLELQFARRSYIAIGLLLAKGDIDKSIPVGYENHLRLDIRQTQHFEWKMSELINRLNEILPIVVVDDSAHRIVLNTPQIKPVELSSIIEIVSQAMLPQKFQNTLKQMKLLRIRFNSGEITSAELTWYMEPLQIVTEDNHRWMIGFESDIWYSYNHQVGDWVVDIPPVDIE